ncbi:MAG: RNB domain-containing ribonuclease, partial [Candidatus Zixiibacteriota bacterium]
MSNTNTPTNSSEIISFVRESAGRPLKARELSRAMNISADDYRAFRNELKRLLSAGELVSLNRGRIGLPEQLNVLIGSISVTSSGTGFLLSEKAGEQDLLIPPENLLTALDGDRVMVRREGFRRGREAGEVIKVLERARKRLVGVFHRTPHFSLVKPDEQRVHRDLYIPRGQTLSAKDGQKVVVELSEWEDQYRNPEGVIVEVLGRPGDPRVDLLAIVRSYDLTEAFPREAERQARSARKLFTDKEIARREDMRAHSVYTIDPADAKDHDDAVAVEKTASGYRLSVHIADVSFFVREETLLDREAFARGTSVYLPGKVIPMLPEALSNDLCSLRENEDRLAHSVIIDYDESGHALDWRVCETVIRSDAKLSYEEAQSAIDGAPSSKAAKKMSTDVRLAYELAKKISVRRFAAGSRVFFQPEPRQD